MSDKSIIVHRPAIEQVLALTPEGDQMVESALVASAAIARVTNDVENKLAVDAQIELKRIINLLETTRVETTKPALEFQRQVKAFFDQRAQELKDEMFRTGKLTANFATLQLAKARAEENARKEELTKLEREREASLAKAETHEQREIIQEHFDERAKIESQPIAPTISKAKGQSVGTDVEVTISDIYALARAHPSCVDMKPRMTDIKALIKAGMTVPGVSWREVVKSSVRVPGSKTIEV